MNSLNTKYSRKKTLSLAIALLSIIQFNFASSSNSDKTEFIRKKANNIYLDNAILDANSLKASFQKNNLGAGSELLPIIPGMIAQVDILTGKKTLLSYLLKPILKIL